MKSGKKATEGVIYHGSGGTVDKQSEALEGRNMHKRQKKAKDKLSLVHQYI